MARNQRRKANPTKARSNNQQRARNNPNTNRTNAYAAQASNLRRLGAGPEPPLIVRGNGRIAQATVATGGADGAVVFDKIISTSLFPRLSRIASAYQRYRFTKLHFQIQPMCPSLTGGGYVAGFLKDPTDSDASFDAIQGSFGATVAKWWEHSGVVTRPAKDLLWTSTAENVRLSSPGKFVLTQVGSNTDLVNVSVMCDWEAELSVPSLEEDPDNKPVTEYFAKQITNDELTNNMNSINTLDLLDVQLEVDTVIRCTVPFGIDYRLGSGDVTKAFYTDFKVRSTTPTLLNWGIYNDSVGTFLLGQEYLTDGQPTQVIIAAGSRFDVLFDPNA